MAGTVFTPQDVSHIATLATIPVSDDEKTKLAAGFTTTISVVEKLFTVDVTGIEPTHQVTGLSNVFRDDEVDEDTMLSQNQALSQAKQTYNGYFVVDQVLES